MNPTPTVSIFGCFGRAGHRIAAGPIPPYSVERACDMLPPAESAKQQIEGAIIRMDQPLGWSYVTWWDRQGDERGGSHTGILAQGVWTEQELIRVARGTYPWAFRVTIGGSP